LFSDSLQNGAREYIVCFGSVHSFSNLPSARCKEPKMLSDSQISKILE
jgi:hypothetical protein